MESLSAVLVDRSLLQWLLRSGLIANVLCEQIFIALRAHVFVVEIALL